MQWIGIWCVGGVSPIISKSSLQSLFTEITCASCVCFIVFNARLRSSIGDSFIMIRLALDNKSSSSFATSGSQSDMATVFPPCSFLRAGSMKIQSSRFICCKWVTASSLYIVMWFRPSRGKLCEAISQSSSWRSTYDICLNLVARKAQSIPKPPVRSVSVFPFNKEAL